MQRFYMTVTIIVSNIWYLLYLSPSLLYLPQVVLHISICFYIFNFYGLFLISIICYVLYHNIDYEQYLCNTVLYGALYGGALSTSP